MATPFSTIWEEETKLLPFTLSGRLALPAAALEGERLPICGTGLFPVLELFTVNDNAADGLPAGFVTVTAIVPGVEIAAAGMLAVTWEAVTKVVFMAIPPKLTTAPDTKLLPETVKVNASAPAVALAGVSALTTGCPLLPPETTNGNAALVPPPGAGVTTVMFSVPACARSPAGMVAWSNEEF